MVEGIVLKIGCSNGVCLAIVNLKVNMRITRVYKNAVSRQLGKHTGKGMTILILCYHYNVASSVGSSIYDTDVNCCRQAIGVPICCYESKAVRPIVVVIGSIDYSAGCRIDKA